MHPHVWKCSGHYDLFHDMMVDCRQTNKRYRFDQVRGRWAEAKGQKVFVSTVAENEQQEIERQAQKLFKIRAKNADQISWDGAITTLDQLDDLSQVLGPDASEPGTLTEPREFNLMFKTIVGAMGTDEDAAFLRPETAQGIFCELGSPQHALL